MKLELTEKERSSLLRTLRWVMTATVMDGAGEERLKSIIRRLEGPPSPPQVK